MSECLELSIETDNAAFDNEPATEIARILRVAALKIENGVFVDKLFDINGNRVGAFIINRK